MLRHVIRLSRCACIDLGPVIVLCRTHYEPYFTKPEGHTDSPAARAMGLRRVASIPRTTDRRPRPGTALGSAACLTQASGQRAGQGRAS